MLMPGGVDMILICFGNVYISLLSFCVDNHTEYIEIFSVLYFHALVDINLQMWLRLRLTAQMVI